MKDMTRRKFVKTVGASALAVAATPLLSKISLASAAGKSPDLVAVRGENIEEMIKKGIKEFGGLPIKRGDKVCIKPNMAWAVPPEGAANTNPEVLRTVVEEAFAAGASEVFVFDHTCDNQNDAYNISGLKAAAEQAGARVMDGNRKRDYTEVKIPDAAILKSTLVHNLILDTDVFINIPILKHHGGTGMTCAMKNLMGAVWERRWWHARGLNQCIADSCIGIKPTLNIVDAYKVMLNGGPRGNNSSQFKMPKTMIICKDIVAIDVASAMTFGGAPEDFPYIRMGASAGVGTSDLDSLNIKRLVL
jgi:uncharacterized protein (DUF362 family)